MEILVQKSFNPCFAGSCFATEGNPNQLRAFLFQSLFCWKLFCNSIRLSRIHNAVSCFNPCFAGSCFATLLVRLQSGHIMMFQSLFCWKLFCNPVTKEESMDIFMFQSLFCWKLFCNGIVIFRTDEINSSFNPCFAGSCFATLFP